MVNSISEVQQKLFGFENFNHGERKNRKRKNVRKMNNIQSELDVIKINCGIKVNGYGIRKSA